MSPDQMVTCIYAEEGKRADALFAASFSVFLRQQLGIVAKRPVDDVGSIE